MRCAGAFRKAVPELEKDLADCAEAAMNDKLTPKKALALVQALSRHGDALLAAARASRRVGS